MAKYKLMSSKITQEFLFERIEADPLEHLGSYSPEFLGTYFTGYGHARHVHNLADIEGRLSIFEFNRWFCETVTSASQGYAAHCLLLTDSEEEALQLFFEFRKLALPNYPLSKEPIELKSTERMSALDLITHEAMRTRPAMYFGNCEWTAGIWAYWNGYVWAEKDAGFENSSDTLKFHEFQAWLDKRCPFANGARWGKLFQYLGMGVKEKAYEQLYDHLDLFLDGQPYDAPTKRMRDWMDACLKGVIEKQGKGEL